MRFNSDIIYRLSRKLHLSIKNLIALFIVGGLFIAGIITFITVYFVVIQKPADNLNVSDNINKINNSDEAVPKTLIFENVNWDIPLLKNISGLEVIVMEEANKIDNQLIIHVVQDDFITDTARKEDFLKEEKNHILNKNQAFKEIITSNEIIRWSSYLAAFQMMKNQIEQYQFSSLTKKNQLSNVIDQLIPVFKKTKDFYTNSYTKKTIEYWIDSIRIGTTVLRDKYQKERSILIANEIDKFEDFIKFISLLQLFWKTNPNFSMAT